MQGCAKMAKGALPGGPLAWASTPRLIAVLLLLLLQAVRINARQIPPYERGPGKYLWLLTELERERGISYFGAAERLRAKMKDLADGKRMNIVTIGGSITAGQGSVDAPSWSQYVGEYFQDNSLNGNQSVGYRMAAVGGTLTQYMTTCYNMHVPKDADVIFMEYSVNDPPTPGPRHYQNDPRQGFERLVRKLLTYPSRPAIVLMHAFQWFTPVMNVKGIFWHNAERELGEFALFYGLPELSLKAATYHLMAINETGFQVDRRRLEDQPGLKDISFYWDEAHPDGRTGARAMAELAIHLMLKAQKSLETRPVTPEETAAVAAPLPPPMVPGNDEAQSEKCFLGKRFTEVVVEKTGWEWINESDNARPRWGMISKTPGATLKVKVDTSAPSLKMVPDALVELAYQQTFEGMGMASVKCESGCTCQESTLQGNGTEQNKDLHLHKFRATQHAACLIAITVLPETASGGHKVKVSGVMVSEQHGNEGVANAGCVEYVHDISMRAEDGIFELHNHAR